MGVLYPIIKGTVNQFCHLPKLPCCVLHMLSQAGSYNNIYNRLRNTVKIFNSFLVYSSYLLLSYLFMLWFLIVNLYFSKFLIISYNFLNNIIRMAYIVKMLSCVIFPIPNLVQMQRKKYLHKSEKTSMKRTEKRGACYQF